MGFSEKVTVIAWGLSLERPTIIKYKFKDIRAHFFHRSDLNMTRAHPIVQLDIRSWRERAVRNLPCGMHDVTPRALRPERSARAHGSFRRLGPQYAGRAP